MPNERLPAGDGLPAQMIHSADNLVLGPAILLHVIRRIEPRQDFTRPMMAEEQQHEAKPFSATSITLEQFCCEVSTQQSSTTALAMPPSSLVENSSTSS